MRYYKTSQPVPGKGDAWMYYECTDEDRIRRYLTYIPMTGEVERIAKPFIKTLQRKEALLPATEEEFLQFWPYKEGDLDPTTEDKSQTVRHERLGSDRFFFPEMTVMEAMDMHPRVGEVFAAFHLGGCSSCGVAEYETIEQVCWAYGVEVETLLDVMEGLMDEAGAKGEPESTDEEPVAAD